MRILLFVGVMALATACGKKLADVTIDAVVSFLDNADVEDATPIADDVTPADVTATAK